jgi:uncharacterized protein YutE (UPF0331/DUF86 family)
MGTLARRLSIIETNVEKLKHLRAKISYNDFLTDDEMQAIAERRLHVCLEALIDVGFRIVSLLGLEKPEKYRDLPKILAKSEVIPPDQRQIFERMISFRNVLVHLYAELDSSRVYEVLRKINDIEKIASYIADFIRRRDVDP